MSNGLLRTRFTFDTESEIRYIAELPEIGDSVAHRHELWRVASAEEDDLGFSVICERPLSAARD